MEIIDITYLARDYRYRVYTHCTPEEAAGQFTRVMGRVPLVAYRLRAGTKWEAIAFQASDAEIRTEITDTNGGLQ